MRIVVVGGGASGFFAAIRAAELCAGAEVVVLERASRVLAKVRISGGGRCNVTNACSDPRELSRHYPRGGRELLGAFHQFGPSETVAWFAARNVALKKEPDGRMFPVTDQSQTIIDCLVGEAHAVGARIQISCEVVELDQVPGGGFALKTAAGAVVTCDRLMVATGGCRGQDAGQLARALGHTLLPPVPSLFTFKLDLPWLRSLAGITLPEVALELPGKLRERGPILITHEGLSGPAVLRLSAWGAREFSAANYDFSVKLNWLPARTQESLAAELKRRRSAQPARYVSNWPLASLPARLWEQLTLQSGIPPATRWADLSGTLSHRLMANLSGMMLRVKGKSLNQDEFVTCGGIPLTEVNLKKMESRICPGLFFGGELLDIDGLTGGFNFQAAWTTGWLAGTGLAG